MCRLKFEVALVVYRIQKPVANNVQISIHAPVKAANFLNAVVSSTALGSPILPFDSTGGFFSYGKRACIQFEGIGQVKITLQVLYILHNSSANTGVILFFRNVLK